MKEIDHAVVYTNVVTTYFDADGNVIDNVKTNEYHFINYKMPISDNVVENKYNEAE